MGHMLAEKPGDQLGICELVGGQGVGGGEVEGRGRDASSGQRHPASSVHIGHIQFILHWSLSRSGTSTMMALMFIMAIMAPN